MENYTRDFSAVRLTDVPEVGGKNASPGEMITALAILLQAMPLSSFPRASTAFLSTPMRFPGGSAISAKRKSSRKK